MEIDLDKLTLRFLGLLIASLGPLGKAADAVCWVYDTATGLLHKLTGPIPHYTVDLTKKTYGDDRIRVILAEGSCNCHGHPEPWSQHRNCVLDDFEGGRQMVGGTA